ncbi:hypothetical protein LEP1GSC037_0919 [Leptospira interrogans str. 2006001854]|uniref:Uncharacterized protein n=1 Tax=Leptospira interrogans str. 2006001854 TaxID=1001590 RepID=M6G832_LEPIR|nr:hypothetical protein LEP1GSC037_0919 [Leptospira interrogans str. 2006001854]
MYSKFVFSYFFFWEVIVAFQRILKKAKRKFNPSQKFWNQFQRV